MISNKNIQDTNTLFPVFLKPGELDILIVGGGNTGYEKVRGVLKNSPSARVLLVAPEIKKEVIILSGAYPGLKLLNREFREEDLEGIDILIAATKNSALNEQIRKLAKKKKILVNVADTPDMCDFYLGAVVTKGDLKIAISTNGKSPTFAKRFREYLEEILPDDLPAVLKNLKIIRDNLKGDFATKVKVMNTLTSTLLRHERKP